MDAALECVRELAATTSGASRQQLAVELYRLAHSLEDSETIVHRFGYLHLQTAAVKIGFDLGLFKLLSASKDSHEAGQIADKLGGDKALIGRYLRYLVSIGVIDKVGEVGYAANHTTRLLTERVAESGISHCFQTCAPEFQALPAFLKQTGYENPADEMNTVFQFANNTTGHQFEWFKDHPQELAYFNDFMASRRKPSLSWLSVYPVEKETAGLTDPSRAVYVNMGGGIGHQCAEFKTAFPSIPGRVILQDLPHTIAEALQTEGVENMGHDFFAPQPIKGAKFYFVRGVCHNHPDHKVRRLLEQVKDAMVSDSVLLLDELVLPSGEVSAYGAGLDLTMMSAFAGAERDESQWRSLIEEAGLKLVKDYDYNPLGYERVMEVRLP